MNTITVNYGQFQVDVYTLVEVHDHFNKITNEHFEDKEEADQYIRNQPSDYYIRDTRLDRPFRGYVRDFRKL